MTELIAEARIALGKKAKTVLAEGRIPAVLYGEGVQTRSISIAARDFERAYRQAGESTLVTLSIAGTPFNVLIHDVAYHPLKGNPIHADFFAVRMDKVIRAMVPINFIGAALDVFEHEPALAPGLAELENVVITPHTASATDETRQAMSALAAQNIIEALEGRTPPNVVK